MNSDAIIGFTVFFLGFAALAASACGVVAGLVRTLAQGGRRWNWSAARWFFVSTFVFASLITLITLWSNNVNSA